MKRKFFDAPADQRCEWTITLRDGSKAQCGRKKTTGQLCTQHAKMEAAWHCDYCGTGNDELPPDHTVDCDRPKGPNVEVSGLRGFSRRSARLKG